MSVSSAVGRMGGKVCEGVFEEAVAFAGCETHVLAVDDCVIDRKIIERLLETDTVKVTTVDSPTRALEMLGLSQEPTMTSSCKNNERHNSDIQKSSSSSIIQAFKFSMIITDYCMPEMTGYDLLRKLKETKGLKEIPVVIISSENVPQIIQRCLDEGAMDFIIKPVQLEDVNKIRRHIIQLQSVHAPHATVSRKRKALPTNLAGEASERRPRIKRVRVP